MPRPFGHLLTLDLYGCKPGVCDDLDHCYRFLEALVDELEMTKQAPPFLFRSPGEFPDKAGLSGWVPLIESGIQIHTLTVKNFISVDIYCCRDFATERIGGVVADFFAPSGIEMNRIARGTRYYDEG